MAGYMINAVFDSENIQKIAHFQQMLRARFDRGVWVTPPTTLHITLMDWLAPLVDYGDDKTILFQRLFSEYDSEFMVAIRTQKAINVYFDTVRVTPNAIIIIGHDDGAIQNIRDAFLKKVDLLPGTKQPPTIIHSTIARFQGVEDMKDIKAIADFTRQTTIEFHQTINSFRLINEIVTPMLEYDVIKEYFLDR